MTAARADFFCTPGSDFTGTITVQNPDLAVASLQYWGSRMQVRRSYRSDFCSH